MTYAVQFTLKSRNAKVGPLPVSTTSKETCPDACPLKDEGCYAKYGPLAIMWAALSASTAGQPYKVTGGFAQSLTWDMFTKAVKALPEGQLWRHNQAGDLPGIGDNVDVVALAKLVKANKGKRGFTYTHKPVDNWTNAEAIRTANAAGFTINLSADNLSEADELAETGVGPVVVVLPAEVHGNVPIATPAGRKVAVCPATYREEVSCATCQLCQRQERKVIVGFPAHGASKRKASAIASTQD